VQTAVATTPDHRAAAPIQAALAERGLVPGEHLVDAATWTRPTC
jgi:hypothetical protein